MRKFALFSALVISLFSTVSSADPRYRCEDIPWFEDTLRDLQSTCNVAPPAPGVCRALGYIGATPEETVRTCAGPGTPHGTAACGADLTCPASVNFCRAHGYIGATPQAAVAACAGPGTPHGTAACGEVLTCQGNTAGFFFAKGYIGATPEEAINACSGPGTPHGRQTCSAAVECRGSAYFCQNWTFTIRALRFSAGQL